MQPRVQLHVVLAQTKEGKAPIFLSHFNSSPHPLELCFRAKQLFLPFTDDKMSDLAATDEKRVVANEELDTVEAHNGGIDHTADLDDSAKLAAYKGDAIEAENAELNLGVWASAKAYPMACWWAFVMSCTIVSCPGPLARKP
jgi:hypothetical protein